MHSRLATTANRTSSSSSASQLLSTAGRRCTSQNPLRAAVAASQPSRACSQCRSVKEWKETHGAWSRTGTLSRPQDRQGNNRLQQRQQQHQHQQLRAYAAADGRSVADEKIEEITELFNTAKDEFELAYEETEKNTVYAADDRAAAEEEFAKMKEYYEEALKSLPSEVGAEIQRRIGQRIKELEEGMKRLNELAMED